MNAIIKPAKEGQLHGTVSAPPSKSYTHRAILLASLAKGRSIIVNPLFSDDTIRTIKACQQLGADIKRRGDILFIDGVNGEFPHKKSPIHIDCGESGTTMRFITAVAGISPNNIYIQGAKKLRERPMEELTAALKSLGVTIASNSHLTINGGKIRGGRLTVSGEKSSQFISALLLIAPYAENDFEVKVTHLSSSPYVDITIDVMRVFGVQVEKGMNTYVIKSTQQYTAQKYTVEGDYSSAAYFLTLKALMKSDIAVTNLNTDSVQGDKRFIEILKQMDENKLHGMHIDLGNNPDLVPIVSILAAYAHGETVIHNIAHLKYKESDRLASVRENLTRMGIQVLQTPDSLTIHGGTPKGSIIDTYNDHRIAMSFAVAGIRACGETVIKNAEVVKKSYPNFWNDLNNIGANVEML